MTAVEDLCVCGFLLLFVLGKREDEDDDSFQKARLG
jgi:hypothetical protein